MLLFVLNHGLVCRRRFPPGQLNGKAACPFSVCLHGGWSFFWSVRFFISASDDVVPLSREVISIAGMVCGFAVSLFELCRARAPWCCYFGGIWCPRGARQVYCPGYGALCG